MAIVIHKNIPEGELHAPKGFTLPATNSMSYAIRSENDSAIYQDIEYLPKAINFVDGNNPAPTAVLNDIYVIFDGGGGVVDASWNGIAFNSWARFDATQWSEVVPVAGYFCYDSTSGDLKKFDGAAWVVVGGGTLLHSGLTLDDGTNPHGTTKSDVGLGSVPNTDFTASVAANTAKVSADGSIDTHSDVDTSTSVPVIGEALIWDGSNWVPDSASANTIYTADDSLTGARTVDQNNFNLSFTNSTIGIGTASPAAASRLHLFGKGSTSATIALLVQNSLGQTALQVKDDRQVEVSGVGTTYPLKTQNLTTNEIAHFVGTGAGTNVLFENLAAGNSWLHFKSGGALKYQLGYINTNSFGIYNNGTSSSTFFIDSADRVILGGSGISPTVLGTEGISLQAGTRIGGNVGINTDLSTYALNVLKVAGSEIAHFTGSGTAPHVLIEQTGTQQALLQFKADGALKFQLGYNGFYESNAFALYNHTSTNSSFYITGSDKIIIGGTGINPTVIGTEKVSLRGETLIKGAGATNATTTLKATNTSNADLLIVRDNGEINASNLPTSSAGLSSGDIWNNAGVLNIV